MNQSTNNQSQPIHFSNTHLILFGFLGGAQPRPVGRVKKGTGARGGRPACLVVVSYDDFGCFGLSLAGWRLAVVLHYKVLCNEYSI